MADYSPLPFLQYAQIANDLRTMSEIIRAARDEPLFHETLLVTGMQKDDTKVYAKR